MLSNNYYVNMQCCNFMLSTTNRDFREFFVQRFAINDTVNDSLHVYIFIFVNTKFGNIIRVRIKFSYYYTVGASCAT